MKTPTATLATAALTLVVTDVVYPVTNAFGSILGKGTTSTKVVRAVVDDFVYDWNFAAVLAGELPPSYFTLAAKDLHITATALRQFVTTFATLSR
jgi:hypothetical protein